MNEKDPQPVPFESVNPECQRLREENARLRQLLLEHDIAIPAPAPESPAPADKSEPVDAPAAIAERARKRVALFRSLFQGREDVYAQRWESRDGRSGYAPAAARDWNAINKSRPEDRKKVERQTRKFFPLTDAVIEDHLLGKRTIGIYPLLADETCCFLAIDFDKKTWEQDALAFMTTSQELAVPASLERSRSGNGAHVWIFFDSAIPATTARQLCCLILTRTMERRHQVGLDSYDRFFPNQDTMPKGGFGNLIALPMQRLPRRQGNSVFLDSELRPYPTSGSSWRRCSGCRARPPRHWSWRPSVRAISSASESV